MVLEYFVMAGVYISQNDETVLTNNSHIIINKQDTLFCHTDRRNCCQNQGHWSYIGDADLQLHTQNGNGTVYTMFESIQFGMFCCQILDISDNTIIFCVNSGQFQLVIIIIQ